MNQFQQWTPVVIIVAGYLLGFFFQNRRLDDLRDLVNKRLDDIKDVLRAEIQSSDAKLTVVVERNHSEAIAKFSDVGRRMERLEGERLVIL